MNTQEAIDAIITEATLPPQIDYRAPWTAKAEAGWDYLKTLSLRTQKRVALKINKAINDYFTEDENGGSPAYYDSLF